MEVIDKDTQKENARVFNKRLDKVQELIFELSDSRLIISGTEYLLREWITLSDYSKAHDCSIAKLTNWIERGVIPDDCVIFIPELNNLKLIRNQPYQARSYKTRG